MAYIEPNKNLWAVISMLITALIASLSILGYVIHLYNNAAKTEFIDIPAYSIEGKVERVVPGVMQKISVYNFAERTFQGLNRWKFDGSEEYLDNIKRFGYVLSPAYKAFLRRDQKRRQGSEISSELRGRTRMMLPLLSAWDEGRVKILGIKNGKPNSWVVLLDMELIETYKGEEIKHLYLRYPIRVVLQNSDRINNPWFLVLDGYQDEPKALSKDSKIIDTNKGGQT